MPCGDGRLGCPGSEARLVSLAAFEQIDRNRAFAPPDSRGGCPHIRSKDPVSLRHVQGGMDLALMKGVRRAAPSRSDFPATPSAV